MTRTMALKYALQLNMGHRVTCAWKDNVSPVSFTTLPLHTSKQTLYAFKERVQRLLQTAKRQTSTFPQLDDSFLKNLSKIIIVHDNNDNDDNDDVMESCKKWLHAVQVYYCKEEMIHFEDIQLHDDLFHSIASIALCGWEPKDENSLYCDMCHRTVGLWNFIPVDVTASGSMPISSGDLPTSSGSLPTTTSLKGMNPVSEHRWYCPWIVRPGQVMSDSQSALLDDKMKAFYALSGWKRCLEVLYLYLNLMNVF